MKISLTIETDQGDDDFGTVQEIMALLTESGHRITHEPATALDPAEPRRRAPRKAREETAKVAAPDVTALYNAIAEKEGAALIAQPVILAADPFAPAAPDIVVAVDSMAAFGLLRNTGMAPATPTSRPNREEMEKIVMNTMRLPGRLQEVLSYGVNASWGLVSKWTEEQLEFVYDKMAASGILAHA